MHQLVYLALFMHVCFHNLAADSTLQTRKLVNEIYYEYVPDHMQWNEARRKCEQRVGSLVSVSNQTETQELARVLNYLNISQKVWIGSKNVTGSPKTLALDFSGRSSSKHARLLHKFPPMGSVTVCTQLRFDSQTFGLSTVFSYSIQSYANEFQLRAQVIRGKPVHLALLVRGIRGPYKRAFDHDDSWHSVCVSWSQNGGHWAIYAHDYVIGQGDGLNSTDSLGPDGLFIIGQEQEAFGGSFKSNESFSGSVTELHIWDRVLNSSEIFTMEKKCSPISSGLVFKWSKAAMEIENSLTKLLIERPCQGDTTLYVRSVNDSSLNTSLLKIENFSLFHISSHELCGIFDPVKEKVTFGDCNEHRGAVCQRKKILDVSIFSKPLFNKTFYKDLQMKGVMEGTNFNSSWNGDLTLLQQMTQVVLDSMEESSPHLLSPSDVLTLSQTIDVIASSSRFSGDEAAEVLMSITTNYVNAASWLLEPRMVAQWMGPTADGVNIGPFTIVESIDSLTKALADTLSAQHRGFSLSTKNIEVYIKWQKLSERNSDQVFNPSSLGSHHPEIGHHDQLLIPDYELKRIHALGSEEVMFIHTHYSRFAEIFSRAEEPDPHQQENLEKSAFPGQLSSAVISAAVRDSSKGQTIPVAVQYILSSHVVKNSQRFTPNCTFWNFSLMHSGGWSSQGCSVLFFGSNSVSCQCNHTTNFAVLMNYMDTEWNPEEELVLSKLTFIGCGASLCALVVTLMLFTVLDIPKSDRTSIHKNLFVALICAQVILLCSGSAIHSKVACTLVAALLHLFFLAAFSWMLVEGLLLWSKVVAVNLNEDRHMKYYYLIGWGLPVLIVTITLASASGKYAADDYCWLSVQNGIIWGFAGPVIFIIMVNILVLTRVVIITISTAKRRSIMLALGASPVKQAYEQIRGAVKAVLVLLPILGLTWLCGVLVPLSIVMAYIFILLNSLQGLFIFLIYGVYNTEVRSTVNRMKERRKALNFSNCASSRPSSSVTNSRPVSFPLGTTPSQEEETCPSLVTEENKTKGEPMRAEESWCQIP